MDTRYPLEEPSMFTTVLPRFQHLVDRAYVTARAWVASWLRPVPLALVAGVASDAMRSRSELVLENALLRHQLVVLSRAAKRPRLTATDRGLLVLLASWLRPWTEALIIVRPETVLRWHRQGFRLFWRRKSAPRITAARIPAETVTLVRRLAAENRLWGAERIRGELLKLDVRVSKRTIQKYMRAVHAPRPPGQSWATFLRNHAHEIWACDFL